MLLHSDLDWAFKLISSRRARDTTPGHNSCKQIWTQSPPAKPNSQPALPTALPMLCLKKTHLELDFHRLYKVRRARCKLRRGLLSPQGDVKMEINIFSLHVFNEFGISAGMTFFSEKNSNSSKGEGRTCGERWPERGHNTSDASGSFLFHSPPHRREKERQPPTISCLYYSRGMQVTPPQG